MISYRELRIGNLIQLNPEKDWYQKDNLIVVVESISNGGINYTHFPYEGDLFWESLDVDRHTPIPLTEEWLSKFGFEKEETYAEMHHKGFVFKMNNLNVLFYENKFSHAELRYDGGSSEDWEFGVDVKYVHQLQNLYFALTGQEL